MAKTSKSTTIARSDAQRMMDLFRGNPRSSGRYDPKRERAYTEEGGLELMHFQQHLAGAIGAGAVPIQDDDTCGFAAIDIDNHDSDEDIPIAKVDDAIRAHRLPLIACRSKSGGVHCYLFCKTPMPAVRIRTLMATWAGQVGYGGSEIFPKQGRLGTTKENKKQLGNWINLPYFDAAKTARYAYRNGKALSLSEFLDLAEASRVTDSMLRDTASADHPEAPPCVQKMYQHGVAQGQRNEALYNTVIYLRKAFPDGYENKALDANNSIFQRPLPRSEALRTIASAGRPDYGYRCNEEPVRSLCDRETCLKRKFGITPADAERLQAVESLPNFGNLVKYLSEPVRWDLQIDGVTVTNISTEALLDWRAMQIMIAERLTKVAPDIKNVEWKRMLQPLMQEARIVDTPDDASVNGVIRDKLREFASKTDLTNKGKDTEDRLALLRGLPVVQMVNINGADERCVIWRGQDFINYLKRTRSEELKGINLWMAVKNMGVQHTKMRVGDASINVWTMPVSLIMQHLATRKEFKSEL